MNSQLPSPTVFDVIRSMIFYLDLIIFIASLIGVIIGTLRLIKSSGKNKRILIYSFIALGLSIVLFIIIQATSCTLCATNVRF